MHRDLIGETLFQQFRVESFLASGGMATMYRVWDLQRNVPLAMKVLHPELAEDPSFIARFQREAQSLQLLVHPHIVPFYGLYRGEGLTFLLERYIDGPSLDELLRRRAGQPLSIHEALVYFKALYTSLGYAHAQGIIHCDVKPGNVLIDQGGHVYLTDFGIARYMDAAITTSAALGTPLYMAPEQIRGERLSPQTDIYSLGVVMFELLTGQRPFRGEAGVPEGVGSGLSDRIRYQHLYVPPPDPRSINPAIPAGLAQVVLKAMAKQPAERYASVADMAVDIEHAVAARFETLPDRVSLPEAIAQGWAKPPLVPGGAAAPPPFGEPWSASGDTLPGEAQHPRPGTGPANAPAARRAPGRRRAMLVLLGVMVLLALCAAAAFSLLRRGLPALPGVPLPGTPLPASPQPTQPTTPGQTPAPTESGLSNFPAIGEVAIVQRVGGIPRLYLLDLASAQTSALPGVPNVDQRSVNAPQWSPDGQRLTWISQYNGRLHVAAMAMDEREPYQLPAGERYSRLSAPAFLPDGQRISFWASDGTKNYLVISDAVSGEAVQTIELPGYRNMFVWNGAQNLVAYVYPAGGSYKVAVSAAPDGGGQTIDTGGEGYAPAWSNDGQWLAFQSDQGRDPGMNDIWIARPDGSDLHAVTSTPTGQWSRAPAWSPDGKMIAFVSNREASTGTDYGELFLLDLSSGKVHQVTHTGGTVYDWRPAWRP